MIKLDYDINEMIKVFEDEMDKDYMANASDNEIRMEIEDFVNYEVSYYISNANDFGLLAYQLDDKEFKFEDFIIENYSNLKKALVDFVTNGMRIKLREELLNKYLEV